MDANDLTNSAPANHTTAERKTDRELVTTRTFDAPVRLVFKAWTTLELFQRWWVPKAFGLTLDSFEADYRVGGKYRLVFSHPEAPEPMAFFGTYLEVTPNTRLVWTNEEAGEPFQVTTVTFEEMDGKTILVVTDLFPSKDFLDQAIDSGATGALPEQFEQLDVILAEME